MNQLLRIWIALLMTSALVVGCGTSSSRTDNSRMGNGATVQVKLDEYHINMLTSFPSGQVTFHVINTGDHKHGFKIKGNGLEQELPSGLSTLETGEMTATLTPGTYEVSCPMLGHSLLGMHLTVTATAR